MHTRLTVTRRGLLLGGLYGLGLAAAAPLTAPGRAWAAEHANRSMSEEEDARILKTALALEHQAIAAYQVGAESGLLDKPVLGVALKFQGHHKAHAQLLATTIERLGQSPSRPMDAAGYKFPVEQLRSQGDVLRFAAGLEQGAASAYLGAVPVLHNRELARVAASILGDEAQHWTVLLSALGDDPVPAAFIA